MSKERFERRRALAIQATTRLHKGETALDGALHEIGMLCAELPTMRQQAQLSAVVGQDVFDHAARANAALVEARRHLVAAHHAFAEVGGQLRVTVMDAPGQDKPPPGNFAQAPARLRAVA